MGTSFAVGGSTRRVFCASAPGIMWLGRRGIKATLCWRDFHGNPKEATGCHPISPLGVSMDALCGGGQVVRCRLGEAIGLAGGEALEADWRARGWCRAGFPQGTQTHPAGAIGWHPERLWWGMVGWTASL